MSEETETAPAAPPATATTPKKKGPKAKVEKKTTKAKTSKEASHPSFIILIVEAVTKLNDKGGSSYAAVKKYIAANHHIDVEKNSHFLKKALKKAVETGKLVQPKGKGASGSFKLAPKAAAAAKKPKAVKPKVKKETGTTTKPKVKKAIPKKTLASPKAAAPKKAAKPTSPIKKAAVKKTTKRKETNKKTAKASPKAKPAKVKLTKKAPAPKKSPKKTTASKKK